MNHVVPRARVDVAPGEVGKNVHLMSTCSSTWGSAVNGAPAGAGGAHVKQAHGAVRTAVLEVPECRRIRAGGRGSTDREAGRTGMGAPSREGRLGDHQERCGGSELATSGRVTAVDQLAPC